MKKQIEFDGKTIKEGHCTTLTCLIESKRFNNFLICSPTAFYEEPEQTDKGQTKEYDTSLTEDEILKLFNESDSFEYSNGRLFLNHPEYNIIVVIK